LELAFDGDKNFDHLNHARRQLVAAFELFNLIFESMLDQIDLSGRALDDPASSFSTDSLSTWISLQ